MMSFFSDINYELFKNGSNDFFKWHTVCKKWTKSFLSIETLNIRKHAPPAFWEKFVGLKNLKISSDCTIISSNSGFSFLKKLEMRGCPSQMHH